MRRKALLAPDRFSAVSCFLSEFVTGDDCGSRRGLDKTLIRPSAGPGHAPCLRRMPAALRQTPSRRGRRHEGSAQYRHGSFPPAAHQRADAGVHLRPDRDRLHDGLRHHRHGELRPWRRVHGRRLHRPHPVHGVHGLARRRRRARAAHGAGARHGADGPVELDHRARRLPAAAGLVPPRAADLRHRHVDLPVQPRPGASRARATSRCRR